MTNAINTAREILTAPATRIVLVLGGIAWGIAFALSLVHGMAGVALSSN